MSQSTSLNPSASEFVPNFTMPNMANLNLNDSNNTQEEQTYQAPVQETHYQNNYGQQNQYNNQYNNQQGYTNQPANQGYYGQNNNTSHRHTYNPNYRGNNYRHNHRGYNNNHHNNNYHGNNYHNNHHQGYRHQQQQQNYDVDPFELEARCDAVIEILQDDKIRDQLNPSSNYSDQPEQSSQQTRGGDNNNNTEPQLDDEEEMAEMMAMQEECRLEMMKFYIQSQNPTLFEEIYHDVSYPEAAGAKKNQVPEEELRSPKVVNTEAETADTTESDKTNNKLRDLIINELNPDVAEFVPIKYNEDESVQTN